MQGAGARGNTGDQGRGELVFPVQPGVTGGQSHTEWEGVKGRQYTVSSAIYFVTPSLIASVSSEIYYSGLYQEIFLHDLVRFVGALSGALESL